MDPAQSAPAAVLHFAASPADQVGSGSSEFRSRAPRVDLLFEWRGPSIDLDELLGVAVDLLEPAAEDVLRFRSLRSTPETELDHIGPVLFVEFETIRGDKRVIASPRYVAQKDWRQTSSERSDVESFLARLTQVIASSKPWNPLDQEFSGPEPRSP